MRIHFKELTGVQIDSDFEESTTTKFRRVLQYFQFVQTDPSCNAGSILSRTLSGGDGMCAAVMLLLDHFKEQQEKMFVNVDDTDVAADVDTTKLPWTPCLVVCGDSALTAKFFMVAVDQVIVNEHFTSFSKAFQLMFCSYYVHNIDYPVEMRATLEFLQRCIFKINPDKGTKVARKEKGRQYAVNPRVVSLISKIANFEEIVAFGVALLYLRRRRPRRRIWVHEILQGREQHGEFHRLVQELRLDGERFQRYFRLDREQFDRLLSTVGPVITMTTTNYRHPIPPAERLAICLRFLATGDSYRTIACSYRVGVSTVARIVTQVTTAIWDALVPEFMPVPTTEDWRSIAEGFHRRWAFPNCLGSIDGKHVVIRAPDNSGSLFYNYKGTYSVVLLAVVDSEYCFRVVDVGSYGRTSDGGVLANSNFGQKLLDGTLDLPPDALLPGADHMGRQPYVFVADEAFPLRRNLMRPFPGHQSGSHRVFNFRLSHARLIVENTFGILTSQWRMYRGVIGVSPANVDACVKATCVLHNFLRRTSKTTNRTTRAAAGQPGPLRAPSADGDAVGLQPVARVGSNNASREAIRVRETLVSMCTHFEVLTNVSIVRKIEAFLEEHGRNIMEFFKLNPTNVDVKAVLFKTDCSVTVPNILQVLMAHFKEPLDALIIQTDVSATPAIVQLTVTLPDTPRLIVAGSSFVLGLAVLFSSFYNFILQYQHDAACTLEFIQRSCIDINPERGTKASSEKVQSKKSGKMVQKKSTSVNPHVSTLVKKISDFKWDFV
ncbi:Protein ALP1-like [Merluccius polli]|uniref:Protein ALP1-like n=1 Tax=Merluccius polli TaxID=89951 RepID=A0AA47NRT7_MERPO|nr:Protein ALP1-like [Merluccius polli]